MKRYGLQYDTSLHQRIMVEHEHGGYVALDDVEPHARTLLAVVERMEHGKTCPAVDPKPVRGEFFNIYSTSPTPLYATINDAGMTIERYTPDA